MATIEKLKKYLTEQLEIVAIESQFLVNVEEKSTADMVVLSTLNGKLIFGQQILKFLEEENDQH